MCNITSVCLIVEYHSFVDVLTAGLGQQRIMPSGLYTQDKACKQEERLLSWLQNIPLDPVLAKVIQKQATMLLEGRYYQ